MAGGGRAGPPLRGAFLPGTDGGNRSWLAGCPGVGSAELGGGAEPLGGPLEGAVLGSLLAGSANTVDDLTLLSLLGSAADLGPGPGRRPALELGGGLPPPLGSADLGPGKPLLFDPDFDLSFSGLSDFSGLSCWSDI